MKRKRRVILIAVGIVLFLLLILSVFGGEDEQRVTEAVESGLVEETISVSGFLEAEQMAELGFPQPGRISGILVKEGANVSAGDLLATIGNSIGLADRQRAVSSLTQAQAEREKLLNGLTLEEKSVSSSTVAQARVAFENTTLTENEKVAAALTALQSTDLVARTDDEQEEASAPTVTGSYVCDGNATYSIEVYRSGTDSGYSIRFDGPESGTAPVSFNQPVSLGECGLSLQFSSDGGYGNSEWEIAIPNTNSNTYLSRLRAYELAKEQAEANIAASEYTYQIALEAFERDTAAPRIEDLIAANAAVATAQSEIARADGQLADQSIYAPFSGVVANIHAVVGETATGPVIDLFAGGDFTLTARVPEIDIAKLFEGQLVVAEFDAAADQPLPGSIVFVSPVATVIDGVSYFETSISLERAPDWLREGLNADISIVMQKDEDTLRIANRFITETSEGVTVLRQTEDGIATTTIEIVFRGTNGYSAITGLEDGDIVVAP